MSESHGGTKASWRKIQADHTRLKHIRHDMPTLNGFDQGGNFGYNHGQLPAPTLAIAKENIEWNAIGKVKLVEILGTPATTGATTAPTVIDPERLLDARNYLHTIIPEDALVEITYLTVPESGGFWVVTKAIGDYALAVTTEGITVRSGSTCGYGVVTFLSLSTAGVLSTTSISEVAYNWTGGAIATATVVRVSRHANGLLVVVGADCSGAALS